MSFTFRPDAVIPEVVVIEPNVVTNSRGSLFEGWRRSEFEKIGIQADFQQDSHLVSPTDVLRGLHVKDEGKLVRCLAGEIFDVAADVRPNSPTFGRWVGVRLSRANRLMLWIPPGFAHGVVALSSDAEVLIKRTSEFGSGKSETGIRWNDPTLAIEWPVPKPIVSEKDQGFPFLQRHG